MRVTSRTRYALAVLVLLYQQTQKPLPLIEIAKQLGLSKLYLEQVIATLKSHQLVQSVKGPSGGYLLQQRNRNDHPADAANIALSGADLPHDG